MSDPSSANKPDIPEEILRSEARQSTPAQPTRLGSLGLPPLPSSVLDLAVRYGPILVLAAGVYGAFSTLAVITVLSQASNTQNGSLLLGLLLDAAASIGMILAYVWLNNHRRLGWNMLAFALIIRFLSQIVAAGVSSILFTGVQLLIEAYLMLQVRDSFSA